MQIHPLRVTIELTAAGLAVAGVGLVAQQAPIVAWGGAILLGVAAARAVTTLTVANIRTSGFEMLWREEPRLRTVARGEPFTVRAEIRNRDSRAAAFAGLRAVASPELELTLSPASGEVPAEGSLEVVVHGRALRVGRHGIHGLSLELQAQPGLFEVPLTFANPFGVEALPAPARRVTRDARGGRSELSAPQGKSRPVRGDSLELKELREHQPGDPFKRIAWKASARRGRLLVREHEHEERGRVWVALDASLELWAGEIGRAPLDAAIDAAASVALGELANGDAVGLLVVGARTLARVEPDTGRAHAQLLLSQLAHAAGTYDADRSDLDERDVALRVLEHLRPLDPESAKRLRSAELDRLTRRAERLRTRAPHTLSVLPWARTPREQSLRAYLAAYGLASPARQESERGRADAVLAIELLELCRKAPRPTRIIVVSPAPDESTRTPLLETLKRLPRRHTELRWLPIRSGTGLEATAGPAAVLAAVAARAEAADLRGEQALRRLRIRPLALREPRLQAFGTEPLRTSDAAAATASSGKQTSA